MDGLHQSLGRAVMADQAAALGQRIPVLASSCANG
jgi:hypothetical protein